MMAQYLLGGLMLWLLQAVFAAVVVTAGVDLPGGVEGPILAYGWFAGPAVVLLGAVRALHEYASRFKIGDHVVYEMPKRSPHPGPRAKNVYAAPHGEEYVYLVPKTWTVVRNEGDGWIEAVTPRGKHHVVRADDPRLHKPGPVELIELRLRWHKHFPEAEGKAA